LKSYQRTVWDYKRPFLEYIILKYQEKLS
jgi:hypothetical protein